MFDTERSGSPAGGLADRVLGAPAAEKADAVEQLDALRNATHAAQLEVIASMERDGDASELGARKTATWLSCKLGISSGEAREWVRVALAFEELPHLREAYANGEMPWEAISLLTQVATPSNET